MATVFSAVVLAVSFMTAAIGMREDSMAPNPQCPTKPKLRLIFWLLLSIIQSIIMLLWMVGCVLIVPVAAVQIAIYCPVAVIGFVIQQTSGHHYVAGVASHIWDAATGYGVAPTTLRKRSLDATVWLSGGFWSRRQYEDPEAQELMDKSSCGDETME
ncbi:hypothetical protein CSAL01_02018 [Colletotrichum salicis]|uniref:Integral membrane protein n=1 Tax=Colletotrichum salicis TaxID=1209931 RepID=A0A135V7R9_9PEZI|nr:hypothetical protein CSAL01_02018 [Colletotrichum salicis]